ncbi:unnamed protein product [Trichobilharzia szidati]|nr:unnamed protein product [Trichobilharzia szidati]
MSCIFQVERVPPKYKFFGYLHVRTGTLLLALVQVLVHLVVITISTVALGHSSCRAEAEYVVYGLGVMSFMQWERFVNLLDKYFVAFDNVSEKNVSGVQFATEDKRNDKREYGDSSIYVRAAKFLNSGEEYVSVALTLFSLFCCMLLLVGVVRAKSRYVLPYSCLQSLDFFVTCLSVFGYFSYISDRKKWMSPHVGLRMLVICVGILLLGLKGFPVRTENSMVFSVDVGCYSFPFLRCCRRNQRPLEDCTSRYSLIAQPLIENSSLPPKYEDVVNTIPNSSGPPTYDTVLNTAAFGDANTLSTGMNVPSPPPHN